MKNYSKKEAISIVFKCAREYKNHLEGRSLLFICTDKRLHIRTLEVEFNSRNFKHLTGLKTTITAMQFYKSCLNQRLSPNDFEFAADGTTHKKLAILPKLITANLSANMIGNYNGKQPYLITEKLAGSIFGCIGFQTDVVGNHYVPNTVLCGDIRDYLSEYWRIILTYRKTKAEPQYSELVYAAKNIDWKSIKLPPELDNLPIPDC